VAGIAYARSGILSLRARLLSGNEIRGLVSFSLPLSATFFVGWVLSSSNIAILRRLSTLGDTADYLFSLSVVSVVALVSQSALLDWPRFYYAEMRDARTDRDVKIAKKAVSFLLIHAATILGVRLLASSAYDLLGAHAYRAGLHFLSFLLLGNFCFLAGNLFAVGIGYAKRTRLTLLTFVIPAVINVGMNLLLIPRYGAVAAAITTLTAYAVFALISLVIGWRFYRFQLLPRFALAFATATFFAFVPLG
jgi:O-antigen/teichoic acid export membrane protein